MKSIKQLAQHLDISIGTVSRALNNKPDVNEETRQRVIQAAQQLGYVPNQSGRSLRKGTTNTVGLVIEVDGPAAAEVFSFFSSVTAGMQSVLKPHHLDLILLPYSSAEDSYEYLKRIVARRFVDALIVSEIAREDPRIDFLARSGLPFVSFGRCSTDTSFSWIDLDFEGAAQEAVQRLVEEGHRRIAIALPDTDVNFGHLLLKGYQAGLKDRGITFDETLVFKLSRCEQGGFEAARRIVDLTEQPTAIVLNTELLALGLYSALAEAGLRVGVDIAVIGVCMNRQARFLRPPLTSYVTSLHDVGISLAETLLVEMRHHQSSSHELPVHRLWPMTIQKDIND